LDSTLKEVDLESVNREYEDELRAYEEEVAKSRRLKVVALFLNEKEKRLSKVKEEIGWLSQTGNRAHPSPPPGGSSTDESSSSQNGIHYRRNLQISRPSSKSYRIHLKHYSRLPRLRLHTDQREMARKEETRWEFGTIREAVSSIG